MALMMKSLIDSFHSGLPSAPLGADAFSRVADARIDRQRLLSLLLGEVDVTRRFRESVLLPNRRHAQHLDGNVEIACQAHDDLQLLVVLLAEHGVVGTRLREQLGDNGRHAIKELRAELILEARLGGARQRHRGAKTRRIDLGWVWQVDQVAASLAKLDDVAILVAGVLVEVLICSKLLGVDEDRGDHPIGALQPFRNQFHVAGMDGAHGGHDGVAQALLSPLGGFAAEGGKGADEFGLHNLRI